MKKKLAVLLAAALTLGMTACGASKGAGDTGKSEKSMVYAVEAGSAGEEAAKEKGFQYNSVSSQADALMEVASGTSDAAIIDLLMAGAMIGEGTSYPNLKHTDELTTEEYGVGCRKDRIWLLISIRCLLTLIKTEAWKKLPKPTVFRKHL